MNGTAGSGGRSNVKQEVVDLTADNDDDDSGNGQHDDDGDKYSYPLSQYDSDYEEDDDQNQNNSTIKQEAEGKEIAKISNIVSLSPDMSPIKSGSKRNNNDNSSSASSSLANHRAGQQPQLNSSGETTFVNDFTLYKCVQCPLRFDSVEELNKHVDGNQHRAESMACCLVCAKSVPSRLLQSHLKNHAGAIKPHPCPSAACPLAFHRFEEWRNHILVHDFMADGAKPVPATKKNGTRGMYNTMRRIEKVDKNDPRIIRTQQNISGTRNRVSPYSVLASPLNASSGSSAVYACPICRQQYPLKAHLELHLAQAHSKREKSTNNNTTATTSNNNNTGGRPVIFATAQPTPQPRFALIINKPDGSNIDKSDNCPVCPHCKAVFISEDYFKTHLEHCTMKDQGTLLNGFGGTAKLVQLPPRQQKPRQLIFVPVPRTQNNVLGQNIVNAMSVGLSTSSRFGNTVYGSSLLSSQQQQQDIKVPINSTPQNQNPFKMLEPQGRKIGILRKTISR